jgi:hypothetical protein
LDIEERVALLRAADVQSSVPRAEVPAPAQALISAFEANILAGHDLLARKQRVDEAFSRRFAASLPSSEELPDDADGAAASSGMASPPI